MLAVHLAVEFVLFELRPDVEALLLDIEEGRAFLPHYAEPVGNALGVL